MRRWLWLLPLSDLLDFTLWGAGWFGNRVMWRGERYKLVLGGRLERVGRPARGR